MGKRYVTRKEFFGAVKIPFKLKKHFAEKYSLDLDQVNTIGGKLRVYSDSKKRHEILSKFLINLCSLLGEMRSVQLFTLEEFDLVNKLIEIASHQPFPLRRGGINFGRPHNDTEAHFIWELSSVITYADGAQKGETCWSDVLEVLKYFSCYYSFLKKVCCKNPGQLRSLKNAFIRRYKLDKKKPKLLQLKEASEKRIKNIVKSL